MDASDDWETIRRSIRSTARAYGLVLSPEDVDDLVQETLLILWERARGPRDPVCLPAYIAQAARNVTLDEVRRRWAKKRDERRTHTLADAASERDPSPTPERVLIARERLCSRLTECQSVLSRRTLLVFVLVYVKGLPSKEVAALLGSSVVMVDSAALRARRVLARRGIVILKGSRR